MRLIAMNKLLWLACVCLLAASCGGVDGSPPSAAPDTAVSNTPSSDPPVGGGPQRVETHDGLADVRPTTFDRFKPKQNGTALDLFFWSGIEECYGVDRIEVEYLRKVISVTIFEGREPHAEACIEIAVRKVVRVELSEPIDGRRVVDGGSSG